MPAPTDVELAPRAWLGAPVAIKPPTEIVFERQTGRNLLIVGSQEEAAVGMLASCLVSLAAQQTPRENQDEDQAGDGAHPFYLFNGARSGSPSAEIWQRWTTATGIDLKSVAQSDLAHVLPGICQLVDQRLERGVVNGPPVFVFVFQLSRFRELRKSDDFAFSSFGEGDAPDASNQFATILREGPAVGVHTLIWCDSYKNLSRWLDRQSLRDFDLRVLQQMSASDSSNLMDTPAASRLGLHRALVYNEERGQSEKFRPYGFPSAEWLGWVQQQLENRCSKQAT